MYRLRFNRFGHAAGTIVYDPRVYDYNQARDDSRLTGIDHLAVTLDPSGGYPVFTVPENDLEKVYGKWEGVLSPFNGETE